MKCRWITALCLLLVMLFAGCGYEATPSDRCVYEASAILKTKSNGTAYSAWASIKLS